MCISSFIGDDYTKNHPYKWPDTTRRIPADATELPAGWPFVTKIFEPASQQDLEKLRKELEDLKILLKKANEFDTEHNEPHCEVEEKIETIKNHGDHLGVDFTEVFDKNALPAQESETLCEPFKVISPEGLAARFSTRQLAEKFVEYLAAYTGKHWSDFQIQEITEFNAEKLNYGIFNKSFGRDDIIAAFTTEDEAIRYSEDLIAKQKYSGLLIKII